MTVSAVDRLVAETTARKRGLTGLTPVKGMLTADTSTGKVPTSLTPVGTERKGIPDVGAVFLTNEAIIDIANDLRKQAAVLIATADGLDALTGNAPASATDPALELKLLEREADRRSADRERAEAGDKAAQGRVEQSTSDANFQERYARLSAEAQAATFKGDFVPAAKEVFGDDLLPGPYPTAASGSPSADWVCPTHGDADIVNLESKRGRKYRACQTCKQFEKGE